MASLPPGPKIYHITHLQNLASIATTLELVSDAKRVASGLSCSLVGLSTIKQRRLTEIEVSCHPGTTVGQYVPFYFCPRSIMLFILHKANNPELTYQGGQEPIIHLEADFTAATAWADARDIRWAFSDGNAGAYITAFYKNSTDLIHLDWPAIRAKDFRDAKVKEGKQAEFLMFDSFPWMLIEKVGTINGDIAERAREILSSTNHQPVISIEPNWYF